MSILSCSLSGHTNCSSLFVLKRSGSLCQEARHHEFLAIGGPVKNRRGTSESFFKLGFGQGGREGVLAVPVSEGRVPGEAASVLGSLCPCRARRPPISMGEPQDAQQATSTGLMPGPQPHTALQAFLKTSGKRAWCTCLSLKAQETNIDPCSGIWELTIVFIMIGFC